MRIIIKYIISYMPSYWYILTEKGRYIRERMSCIKRSGKEIGERKLMSKFFKMHLHFFYGIGNHDTKIAM